MRKIIVLFLITCNLQASAQFTRKNVDSLAAALNAYTYHSKLVTSFAEKRPDWYSSRVAKFGKKDKVLGIAQERKDVENNFYVFSLQSLVVNNHRLMRNVRLVIPLKKEGIESSFFREGVEKRGRMVSEITINIKPETKPEEVQELLRLFRKCQK